MRSIYMDVTLLLTYPRITGIQRVTIEIVSRLISGKNIILLREKKNGLFEIVNREYFESRFIAGNKNAEPKMEKEIRADEITNSVFFDLDAVWGCVTTRLALYRTLKENKNRIITHVYDTIVLSHPQYCNMDNILKFPPYLVAVMRYADTVIVNTQYTKNELMRFEALAEVHRPLDVRVIPLGTDFSEIPGMTGDVDPDVKEITRQAPFVMAVSTIEPRKNHKVLVDAYDMGLDELGIQMVFVGHEGWNVNALMERIRSHPKFGKGLYHLDHVDDVSLKWLYRHAYMVLFPTYIEGYGLSTIEAIQNGAPVALSDIPVMHEVAGSFGDYFLPDQPMELVNLLRNYRNHPEKYEEKKENLKNFKIFTWNDMVEALIPVLE